MNTCNTKIPTTLRSEFTHLSPHPFPPNIHTHTLKKGKLDLSHQSWILNWFVFRCGMSFPKSLYSTLPLNEGGTQTWHCQSYPISQTGEHNNEVWAESVPGSFAEFAFSLPRLSNQAGKGLHLAFGWRCYQHWPSLPRLAIVCGSCFSPCGESMWE